MAERTADIKVKETRLEGETFADAIRAYSMATGQNLNNIPTGDPGQFYSSVCVERISSDLEHAVGLGFDENVKFLIRDGAILYRTDGDIRLISCNGNLGKLVFSGTRYEQYLVLIDQDSEEPQYLAVGKKVGLLKAEDFKTFLVYASGRGVTKVSRIALGEKGRASVRVNKEFDSVSLAAAADNLDGFVWVGRKDGKYNYYRGSEFLGQSIIDDLLVTKDLSRVALVKAKGKKRSLAVDSKEVFKANSGTLILAKGTPDLSIFSAEYENKKKERFILVWREDSPSAISRYRCDQVLSCDVSQDTLAVTFKRDYAKRKLEFVKNGNAPIEGEETEIELAETPRAGLSDIPAEPL